jgi:uncharacterized protein involved in exopolysaccharide biosynthesis
MDDDVKTLGDYISIAWRRKFYILIPLVVVLGVTVATVMLLPPVYKSTGTILIESQQIPEELIQSTVTSFADERIQIIRQRIMTSQQLMAIIKKFDLYKEEIGSTARSEILQDMRKRIGIRRVSANVRGRKRGASALIAFTVSFEHQKPGTARRVANELVTLFLDENVRTRTARAEETSEFLKKESGRLLAQIEEMEEQLALFKKENEGSLPESLRINLERQSRLKTALRKSDDDLNALNERKQFMLIDLETLQYNAEASGGLNTEQQAQRQELKNMQNRYISLSARYGSEHPDVKSIKRQISAFEKEFGNLSNIEELQEQEQEIRQEILALTRKYSSEHPDVKRMERKLEGIESMIANFDSGPEEQNEQREDPKILQLILKLKSLDSNIERIESRKPELEKQIAELDALIDRTPMVERGLDALERDFGNVRRKYQEMKAKQLQAELSQSLEEEQKGERFTLLEPPILPDKPIKPNRPKLFMLGLIMSFGSGLGVAILAETLDGGIRGARTLAAVTKMTPLVAIPNITTRRDEAIRKRNIKILLIAIVLFGIGCVVAVHFFYKPLDLLWYIVLRKLNLA